MDPKNHQHHHAYTIHDIFIALNAQYVSLYFGYVLYLELSAAIVFSTLDYKCIHIVWIFVAFATCTLHFIFS